jgi:hypothetical protein
VPAVLDSTIRLVNETAPLCSRLFDSGLHACILQRRDSFRDVRSINLDQWTALVQFA